MAIKNSESENGIKTINPINLREISEVEALSGIYRRTLAYNQDGMLCHFRMEKGSKVPLHNHIHSQIGFVISGKLKFFTETSEFIASEGDSYVFSSLEKHGAEILEDSVVVEIFIPMREEYKPT